MQRQEHEGSLSKTTSIAYLNITEQLSKVTGSFKQSPKGFNGGSLGVLKPRNSSIPDLLIATGRLISRW